MPSLVNTFFRCHSTVRGLRNSSAPISGFVSPSRASRAMCCLLRRELVARVVAALAHLLAGGQQLVPGALGEAVRAHRQERLARDAQLLARVDPPALAAQPLAVEQARAGELHAHAGAAEALDRLAVERSASSPSLASARTRASIPSAQSLGVDGRALGHPLERGLDAAPSSPVRDAASASSGTTNGV